MDFAAQKFRIGVEEEYLLVDKDSLDLTEAPPELFERCQQELQRQISPEFLTCQLEVNTKVCRTITEVRDDLRMLRSTVQKTASDYGLAPIAVAAHPFADWRNLAFTRQERFLQLEEELAGVVRRLVTCGQHIHVEVEGNDLRIDLMNQLSYFLPHLLSLTTSSPFWRGADTGLASYRLSVFDNLPRTGLPPAFTSYSEYRRSVKQLTNLKVIEDASKIWWDLRPSAWYPTLEVRILDMSPRLSTALLATATTQCLVRMLCRLRRDNRRWRVYERFLIDENRWRAQRYGMSSGLIDFGKGSLKPVPALMAEIAELIAEDAEALGCEAEIAALGSLPSKIETSADRQRQRFNEALRTCGDQREALREVVVLLLDEFSFDL